MLFDPHNKALVPSTQDFGSACRMQVQKRVSSHPMQPEECDHRKSKVCEEILLTFHPKSNKHVSMQLIEDLLADGKQMKNQCITIELQCEAGVTSSDTPMCEKSTQSTSNTRWTRFGNRIGCLQQRTESMQSECHCWETVSHCLNCIVWRQWQ